MSSVVVCILATVSLLAGLGLRYPLKMLPLLFFELLWKSIWLAVVALPLWKSDQLTGGLAETAFANLLGIVIFPLAIPWPYVIQHFVRARGERWTK